HEPGLAAQAAPRLLGRQRLDRRLAEQLLQPQHPLGLEVEHLPVDDDRPSCEHAHHRAGQGHECAEESRLDRLEECWGHARTLPVRVVARPIATRRFPGGATMDPWTPPPRSPCPPWSRTDSWTASSRGCTSTPASSSSPRTTRCPCSSGCATCRSSPPTSTSSSWSASPASSAGSPPGSRC